MKKISCDLCGKELSPYAFTYLKEGGRILFTPEGYPKSNAPTKLDLCGECCEKFIRFMESGGKHEN